MPVQNNAEHKDLIVLVADKNMEFAIRGLLKRFHSLGIRQITYDIHVHPGHDAGCRGEANQFLKSFVELYDFAIVLFDREGCGYDELTREALEEESERLISIDGWDDRIAVVVFDPELEIWVWSDSPHVERILGWQGRVPNLRDFLINKGYLSIGQIKPPRPKEAMEEILRVCRKPRSSSLYGEMAECVSLSRCQDGAFLKFKQILSLWFAG